MPEAEAAKKNGAKQESAAPAKNPEAVYDLISLDGQKQYDVRDLLASIIDAGSLDEYKADYGKTLVTAYARIGGSPVGIVANQRHQVRTKKAGIQMGGVIYADSADKAARFVMDCNQTGSADPFLPGRHRLHGRPRRGAKRDHSQRREAGERGQQLHRAEDHRRRRRLVRRGQLRALRQGVRSAFHPRLAERALRRDGRGPGVATPSSPSSPSRRDRGDKKATPEELEQLRAKVKETYDEQTDIRYGAARGWVDAIIQPHDTRNVLVDLLGYVTRPMPKAHFHMGVVQV